MFTSLSLIRNAALAGLGLAYLPEDQVQEHTSRPGGSSGCWTTGANHSRATTSITRTGTSTPPPSPCSSRRCATGRPLGLAASNSQPNIQTECHNRPLSECIIFGFSNHPECPIRAVGGIRARSR